MPHFRYSPKNDEALRIAEDLFEMHDLINDSRIAAEGLKLITPDGTTRTAPGEQIRAPFDLEFFRTNRLRVTQVTRSPGADFIHVRSRSTPLFASRRVIESLQANNIGTFFSVRVELEYRDHKPPKKPHPDYFALFPAPAGDQIHDDRPMQDPFSIPRHIMPPVHHPGVSDLFAIPSKLGGIGPFIYARRRLVEIALEEKWTNVAFKHANLPQGISFHPHNHVRRTPDGSLWTRPPMPTEMSPEEWFEYALNHPRDEGRHGTLSQGTTLALIHHTEALLPIAIHTLRNDTDIPRLLTAASLVREAASQHNLGRTDTAPDPSDTERAKQISLKHFV